jgi:hypothetical protein
VTKLPSTPKGTALSPVASKISSFVVSSNSRTLISLGELVAGHAKLATLTNGNDVPMGIDNLRASVGQELNMTEYTSSYGTVPFSLGLLIKC